VHRSSLRRSENSAIAEKQERQRNTGSLGFFTRWRRKRNYRWVVFFVAATLIFGHAFMRYIDWFGHSSATHISAYGDTSTRIHHHRREGNPSQAAPVKEAKDRGFRNRLKKTMQARISGEKEVPRHPIENGLLAVNLSLPVSAHPIKQLINDANVEWEAKKEKQSQTLEQAVAEYKRRNRGMNPPKGFNKWWKFVM
jgi:hypothetical protein